MEERAQLAINFPSPQRTSPCLVSSSLSTVTVCALCNASDRLLLFVLEVSKVLPELLEEDEGNDCVRSEPDKGRDVSFEEGQWTLLGREPDQIQGTLELAGLGVHCAGLEDVQRLGEGRGDGALKNQMGFLRYVTRTGLKTIKHTKFAKVF